MTTRPAKPIARAVVALLALAVLAGVLRSRRPRPDVTPDRGAADAPASGLAAREAAPALRLLVPAYFYPAGTGLDEWDRLMDGAARAPITAVVNPNSGPGEAPDPNYVAIVRRAKERGVVAIGYVITNYAKRPLAEVRSDVEKWARFYPEIRGVFLDSQAEGGEHRAYYDALRAFIAEKIPGASVVTNPGVICDEVYFARPAMDAACVFEAPDGFDGFRLPAWAYLYPAARFAALPYRVGEAEKMKQAVAQAARGRIGSIYVTDAGGDNPWARLPVYWEAEVDAVRRVNQRQAP